MSNLSKNYIAGDWTEGVSTITNVNPSDTTDIIGQYAQASSVQLDDALNVTQIAQRQWAATGLEQRQAVLMKIGEEMMVRSTELGEYSPVKKASQWLKAKAKFIVLDNFSLITPRKYYDKVVIQLTL